MSFDTQMPLTQLSSAPHPLPRQLLLKSSGIRTTAPGTNGMRRRTTMQRSGAKVGCIGSQTCSTPPLVDNAARILTVSCLSSGGGRNENVPRSPVESLHSVESKVYAKAPSAIPVARPMEGTERLIGHGTFD
jgi:hypothetical protein